MIPCQVNYENRCTNVTRILKAFFVLFQMSSYSFYPGTPSFLAMKYLRTYTPSTQLQPGERYRLRRNMEAKVRSIFWSTCGFPIKIVEPK